MGLGYKAYSYCVRLLLVLLLVFSPVPYTPVYAQQTSFGLPSPELDNGNSGTAITISFLNKSPVQKVTRNGNCTFTLTAPSSPGFVQIKFIHDATANVYTVTFSPTVKFPSGTAPSFTNTNGAIDILTLYYDGASWYGSALTNFS